MPKWSDTLKRFFERSDFTLKASAAEVASTNGATVEVGEGGAASITVDVTVVSGTTPTLQVVIEGSNDGATWYTLATFGANGYSLGSLGTAPSNITGVSTIRGAVPGARYMRSRSVIGGTTPSFTYSVAAEVEGY